MPDVSLLSTNIGIFEYGFQLAMKKSYDAEEKKPITPVMMGPRNENMIAMKPKADMKSLGKFLSCQLCKLAKLIYLIINLLI